MLNLLRPVGTVGCIRLARLRLASPLDIFFLGVSLSSCHLKAAFYLEIPSAHKLVLLAICQTADKKDGTCFPGQKLLVQMTSLHIRTVQRSLDWLEQQGYIIRKERRRETGYRTSDLYKLNFLDGTESPDIESGGVLSGDNEYELRRQSVNSQAAQSQGNILSTRGTTSDPPVLLPEWMPKDVWNSFRKMRIKIKKPMTEDAERLNIKKLERWYFEGHDPVSIIQNSVMNSWQGLFPPKEEKVSKQKGKVNDIDNQLAELLERNRRGELTQGFGNNS